MKQRLPGVLSIFERLVVLMFTDSGPFARDSFSTGLFFNHELLSNALMVNKLI